MKDGHVILSHATPAEGLNTTTQQLRNSIFLRKSKSLRLCFAILYGLRYDNEGMLGLASINLSTEKMPPKNNLKSEVKTKNYLPVFANGSSLDQCTDKIILSVIFIANGVLKGACTL